MSLPVRPHMNRRTLLKLAAAGATLAACAPRAAQTDRHVAVIGGGIVGTSIAWHLAKAGAQVSLFDRHDLATRASRGTFAWINATWAKQPRHYHQLSQQGVSGWSDLQAELDLPVRWGGSLEWFGTQARQDRLVEQIAEQVAWGEPARMIAPGELAELEPHLVLDGISSAAYSPNDGTVDPVEAVQRMAAAAMAEGACIHTQCAVHATRRTGSGATILETDIGEVPVDRFVLATGADPEATRQLAGIEIPQRSTPGVIVITRPMPRIANRIIVAPGVHIHQRDDGRVVLGEQAGAPDTAAHAQRLGGRPNSFPDPGVGQEHALRILAIAETYLPGMLDAAIEDVFIGWRPLPLDGHPVLGAPRTNPAAYLAIMHSGVSLAPIIGDIATREILGNTETPGLAPYRPDREFERVSRY